MKKPSLLKLPPGLAVEDMPGGTLDARRLNHSLYRREGLGPQTVQAIRRRLGIEKAAE